MIREPNVVPLPTVIPPESAIADPDLDTGLDAARFQDGFDDAADHLASLPVPWARQHARAALARPAGSEDDPSFARGYRAALHGFLRHTSR